MWLKQRVRWQVLKKSCRSQFFLQILPRIKFLIATALVRLDKFWSDINYKYCQNIYIHVYVFPGTIKVDLWRFFIWKLYTQFFCTFFCKNFCKINKEIGIKDTHEMLLKLNTGLSALPNENCVLKLTYPIIYGNRGLKLNCYVMRTCSDTFFGYDFSALFLAFEIQFSPLNRIT